MATSVLSQQKNNLVQSYAYETTYQKRFTYYKIQYDLNGMKLTLFLWALRMNEKDVNFFKNLKIFLKQIETQKSH